MKKVTMKKIKKKYRNASWRNSPKFKVYNGALELDDYCIHCWPDIKGANRCYHAIIKTGKTATIKVIFPETEAIVKTKKGN